MPVKLALHIKLKPEALPTTTHKNLAEEAREELGIGAGTLRLSVGVEDDSSRCHLFGIFLQVVLSYLAVGCNRQLGKNDYQLRFLIPRKLRLEICLQLADVRRGTGNKFDERHDFFVTFDRASDHSGIENAWMRIEDSLYLWRIDVETGTDDQFF
jgi:hypothetical protein